MAASSMLSASHDILGKEAGSKTIRKSAPAERPAQPPRKCPECSSSRIWKDGLRYMRGEIGTTTAQRYICRECGRRFSETASYLPPNRGGYNRISGFSTRQVCVALAEGSKNLVRVESRIKKRAAGAAAQADIKGKLVEFLWHLKKQGYAEATVRTRLKLLKRLVRLGADIFDPESVKKVLAEQPWKSNSKFQAVIAYDNFAEMTGIRWEPPNYRRVQNLPFVPTETEINQLIAGVGPKLATFLQLLKETGARYSEAFHLEQADIDLEHQTVNITPKKGSNPRILPISHELVSMLSKLPKDSTRIFGDISPRTLRANLWKSRKRIAQKLSNPRFDKISFHSLRHWKATMEYHQTKDIIHVKKVLGHRNIQNTMTYIDMEQALFNSHDNDQFTVRVAETVEEACELVEAGFEYVTDVDEKKLFRKRK